MAVKRRVVVAAVSLAAAAAAIAGFALRRPRSESAFRTAAVDRGAITRTVTATGALSAVTTVKVGSQVSGIIAALHADFNNRVRKGDLLAELDTAPFQARVDQSRAGVEKAKVDLRNAEISLRRQKALRQEDLAPEADLDAAQAKYDSSRAAVMQAEAALDQALTDLRNSRIVAPISGVVVDRQYDVGQTVAASYQAPTLFTLAQDLTKMQVSANVSESDVGQIEAGQPVRFTVDAYPERAFHGAVSQIRLNAVVNQNVVTYPVIVEVDNSDGALRPTMTANVSIDVATAEGALRLPNAALRWRPEMKSGARAEERAARLAQLRGSAAATRPLDASRASAEGGRNSGAARRGTVVFALAGGAPKLVRIRTGISDGRYTQIVSGDLQEGDSVVVGLITARTQAPAAGFAGAMTGRAPASRRGF